MNEHDDIIRRFKQARKAKGLSYQELANATGLSRSTLQRYETGSIQNFPLGKLKDVADALGVTPEYLLGREEELPLIQRYGLTGEMEEMAEAMHKNPRLGLLFSRSSKMDADSVEAVLRIVELMNKEQGLGD